MAAKKFHELTMWERIERLRKEEADKAMQRSKPQPKAEVATPKADHEPKEV